MVDTLAPLAPTLAGLSSQLRALGLRRSLALAVQHRLRRRLGLYQLCSPLLEGRACLEIGGPSAIFRRDGPLPVYALASSVDNCNFAEQTVWQGQVEEGQEFRYDASLPPGRQHIADATDLRGTVADASYDALLASHVIEHIANPLRALREWSRVLAESGTLVLVVPHRETTFDHRRPLTSVEHLVEDFERGVGEDDATHVDEFVALCDLDRDAVVHSREELAERTARFVENRSLHHHVFDTLLVLRMLDRAGFQLLGVETALPFHIVAVARRLPDDVEPSNEAFVEPGAAWRASSWFASDRPPA
jgi:SAM-dependent methyltransferase